MDNLHDFNALVTNGFIAIQALRLERSGAAKIQRGEPLTPGP